MKITAIETRNVQGVPNLRRSLQSPSGKPMDVVLVTGPAGAGKSRLLRAIAAWKESIGPYGAPPRVADLAVSGAREAFIEGTWLFTDEEAKRGPIDPKIATVRVDVGETAKAPDVTPGVRRALSLFFREGTHGKVALVSDVRRMSGVPLPVSIGAFSEKVDGARRLTDDPDKHAAERAWLIHKLHSDAAAVRTALTDRGVLLSNGAPDPLRELKASIAKLVPHLRLVGLAEGKMGPTARFRRADGGEVDIDDLSGAEHQGVLFAATFHRIALHRSVVLIDTPELHIHPADRGRFFREVCEMGTDNQIIAATTSPALLGAVPPEQIIDLGRAGGKAGVS